MKQILILAALVGTIALVIALSTNTSNRPNDLAKPSIGGVSKDIEKPGLPGKGVSTVSGRAFSSVSEAIQWESYDTQALVNGLADPKLSPSDRNRYEQTLGVSGDWEVDSIVADMLEDGLLDLNLGQIDGQPLDQSRLVSAIRIAGLRANPKSVPSIIEACSHDNAGINVKIASYTALGYFSSDEVRIFLREQAGLIEGTPEQDGFVGAQIFLSLGNIRDAKSSPLFLKALDSPDPELRDAAIIALGQIRSAEAVSEFQRIYNDAPESSRVNIRQALHNIDTSKAREFLSQVDG